MRAAFSIVSVIFLIVLISSIATLSLALSTQSSRQSSDLYLKTQAEILAKSATEAAIFKLLSQKDSFDKNCPNGEIFVVNFPDNKKPIFKISVKIVALFGKFGNTCGIPIATEESIATVVLDTFVEASDGLNWSVNQQDKKSKENEKANYPITFHKRTIQKL